MHATAWTKGDPYFRLNEMLQWCVAFAILCLAGSAHDDKAPDKRNYCVCFSKVIDFVARELWLLATNEV